jgi:hypothetical protein
MSNKEKTPFIGEHAAGSVFNDLPAGEKQTMFEEFTDNHNKAKVESGVFNDNPITLIIKTKDGNIIERTVDSSGQIGFQVEDIEKVSVVCNAALGTCSGFVNVEKTFCIICETD